MDSSFVFSVFPGSRNGCSSSRSNSELRICDAGEASGSGRPATSASSDPRTGSDSRTASGSRASSDRFRRLVTRCLGNFPSQINLTTPKKDLQEIFVYNPVIPRQQYRFIVCPILACFADPRLLSKPIPVRFFCRKSCNLFAILLGPQIHADPF